MLRSRPFLAFILILGLTLLGLGQISPDRTAETAAVDGQERSYAIGDNSRGPEPTTRPAVLKSSPASPTGDSEDATPLHSVVIEGNPHEWINSVHEEVWSASPGEYDENRAAAEQGDPEAAFWLAYYYYDCIHMPREPWQLDARLKTGQEQIDQFIEKYPDKDLPDRLLKYADNLEMRYAACSILPEDFDTTLAAIDWMEVAADLGHMGAQFAYYEMVGNILIGNYGEPLGFHNPELIYEFKFRADTYAKALLRSDHPERYLFVSLMYSSGFVYEQDRAMAYAYARAAELAVPEMADRARITMSELERWVSPEERRDANKAARALIEK